MQTTPDKLRALVSDTLGRDQYLSRFRQWPSICGAVTASASQRFSLMARACEAFPPADSLIDLYVLTGPGKDDRTGSHVANRLPARASQCLLCRDDPRDHPAPLQICHVAARPVSAMDDAATSNPYFWARFAQPSALVYCAGEAERQLVTQALCNALATAFGKRQGAE